MQVMGHPAGKSTSVSPMAGGLVAYSLYLIHTEEGGGIALGPDAHSPFWAWLQHTPPTSPHPTPQSGGSAVLATKLAPWQVHQSLSASF